MKTVLGCFEINSIRCVVSCPTAASGCAPSYYFPASPDGRDTTISELGHRDFLLFLKQDRQLSETSQEQGEDAQNSASPLLSGKRVVSLAVSVNRTRATTPKLLAPSSPKQHEGPRSQPLFFRCAGLPKSYSISKRSLTNVTSCNAVQCTVWLGAYIHIAIVGTLTWLLAGPFPLPFRRSTPHWS